MRVVIIDGDNIPYVGAWLNKDKSDDELYYGIDNYLTEILQNTNADKYVGILKNPDEGDIRRMMFNSYKATRQESPEWYVNRKPIIVNYLLDKWKFAYTQRMYETDDACASISNMLQLKGIEGKECIPIISSVDKDLAQCPGWLYNPRTKQLKEIEPAEAGRNLCLQILLGDSTDNVKSVRKGIGEVKGTNLFDHADWREYGIIIPDEHRVLKLFTQLNGYTEGLIKFAENVLQVVMRRDIDYPYELVDVPSKIVETYNVKDLFK